MFSKKSLHITLAFVLLIGLASLGLAYGAWTDTLFVNGTVKTGSLDVMYYNQLVWWEYDPANTATCENIVEGDLLTIKVTNGYPGLECSGSAAIVNIGTIPVKITVEKTSAGDLPGYLDVSVRDAKGIEGSTFTLQPNPTTITPPYTVYGSFAWDFVMPAAETGHEGETTEFTYTIHASQAQ